MPRLYDLTEGLIELLDLADSQEEMEEETWVAEAIEFLGEETEEKLLNCSMVVKQLEADAAVLKLEKERLGLRQSAFINRAKRLKEYMTKAIQLLGVDDKGKYRKFRNELFSVWIQKNPMSFDRDETKPMELPEEFVNFEPVVDYKALGDHIKSTGEIPEGAVVKDETHSVRIR